MTGGPRYSELAPDRLPAPIRDLVECAWRARTPPGGHRQRVLPDGCMDLILTGGPSLAAERSEGHPSVARTAIGTAERSEGHPSAATAAMITVAGPDTVAHEAEQLGDSVVTGLRFRAGALPALLGVPADVVRDRRVALSDLLRAEMRTTGTHRSSGAADANLPADLGVLLRTATGLACVADRRQVPEPLPRPALRALGRGMAVAEVADRLGVTSRTLHRRCVATLGYGPSTARRILRFRTASLLLFDGVAPAEAAARAGYADQPHLSREVRALSGLSPAALAQPRA